MASCVSPLSSCIFGCLSCTCIAEWEEISKQPHNTTDNSAASHNSNLSIINQVSDSLLCYNSFSEGFKSYAHCARLEKEPGLMLKSGLDCTENKIYSEEKLLPVANAFPQLGKSHVYGLSPVWTRSWTWKKKEQVPKMKSKTRRKGQNVEKSSWWGESEVLCWTSPWVVTHLDLLGSQAYNSGFSIAAFQPGTVTQRCVWSAWLDVICFTFRWWAVV